MTRGWNIKSSLAPSHKGLSLVFITIFASILISFFSASTAHAINWDAGHIIDDLIFTNSNTMSVQSIQNFLNSKVSSCDTNGTLPATEYGSTLTHAQYAASMGWSAPPYTCLKDYTENGLSAAQIIYNTAQQFQINPEVLIVLLQKEQGLVTDTWPLATQYTTAAGYGCPDSTPGVCSSTYYGFTNQLHWAGTLFRSVLNSSPTWYSPYTIGNNYIQWNPNTSCGGSTVNIQNLSTAALYDYTPYQPNQAALNAGYGLGDSCSSYGNRNFVLYFNDWFGATTNSHLAFSVIQGPGSTALYLQTSAGKYYIPSSTIMQNWGLDTLPIQQVSSAYLDSLATGPNLGNLLKDDWNNYFVVDNKTLHYVRDPSYLSLWGISPNSAVQSLGLAYTIPSGNWLGRFMTDSSQPGSSYWLMDNGGKHLINDPSMLYQWRYTPDQLTSISTAYLNSIPDAPGNPSAYATDGSSYYIVDTGRKLSFPNSYIKSAYYGQSAPVTYASITLSFLPNESASQFTLNSANGQWFMLEGGKKHYIANGSLASIWGKAPNQNLTSLSSSFISSLIDGGNLSYVVQTASPSAYWVIDGNKKYIPDSATSNAWLGQGVSPPVYSNDSLALLSQGINATNVINVPGSPYTYIMMGGIRHYLSSVYAKSAWGGSVISVSNQLLQVVPEGTFLNYLALSTSGQAYLLMNSTKYPIDGNYNDIWGINTSTPTVGDTTLNNYATGATLKAFINIGGTSYIMTGNGQKMPISTFKDTYNASSLGEISLPSDYFASTAEASYLIKSSDNTNQGIWLMNQGKKLLLTFSQGVSLGYLSRGVQPTILSPNTLALIPNDTSLMSNLIQKSGSGIKLLNFGTALGFPDSNTLLSFIPTSSVLTVTPSVYDGIPLTGSVSQVITDDAGKYYLVQSGQRHWITNGTAYQPYSTIPRVYLYGTTVVSIPEGSPIN